METMLKRLIALGLLAALLSAPLAGLGEEAFSLETLLQYRAGIASVNGTGYVMVTDKAYTASGAKAKQRRRSATTWTTRESSSRACVKLASRPQAAKTRRTSGSRHRMV